MSGIVPGRSFRAGNLEILWRRKLHVGHPTYRHADSTFPNSVKTIGENFAGVPTEVREKIVFSNANKLYGLGLN